MQIPPAVSICPGRQGVYKALRFGGGGFLMFHDLTSFTHETMFAGPECQIRVRPG